MRWKLETRFRGLDMFFLKRHTIILHYKIAKKRNDFIKHTVVLKFLKHV